MPTDDADDCSDGEAGISEAAESFTFTIDVGNDTPGD